MLFEFQRLTQNHTIKIANEWKYDGVYSFYDMTEDIEDYEELRSQNEHYEAQAYILNAALFNQRAIRLYRACGFLDEAVITRKLNGGTYEFLTLKKEPSRIL